MDLQSCIDLLLPCRNIQCSSLVQRPLVRSSYFFSIEEYQTSIKQIISQLSKIGPYTFPMRNKGCYFIASLVENQYIQLTKSSMIAKQAKTQEMRRTLKLEEVLKSNKKIVVEVEFCSDCDTHQNLGKHSEVTFLQQYEQLKRRLAQLNVLVRKKQRPEGLLKWSPYSAPNVYFHRDNPAQIIYFPQIGSFEIFIYGRKIFSRLQTHKWPNFNILVAEIYKALLEDRNTSIKRTSKSQRKDPAEERLASSRTIWFQMYEESRNKFYRIRQRYEESTRLRQAIDNQDIVRPSTTFTTRRSINVRKRINSRQQSQRGASFNAKPSNTIQEDSSLLETDRNNSKTSARGRSQNSSRNSQRSNANALDISLAPHLKISDPIVYMQPIFPKTNAYLQQMQKRKQALSQRAQKYKQMQTLTPIIMEQSGINIHIDNNSIRSTARNDKEVEKKINTEEKSTNQNAIDRTIKNTLVGKEQELKNVGINKEQQLEGKELIIAEVKEGQEHILPVEAPQNAVQDNKQDDLVISQTIQKHNEVESDYEADYQFQVSDHE